jgi:transcriptional regulator with XRE-family HTH domain
MDFASSTWSKTMQHLERDPKYIAEQVKYLRKMRQLTQENLADEAQLSTRTIEKVESGRHRPDEQTIRSIARAFQIHVAFFDKPTPEQEARQKARIDQTLKKTVLVSVSPVRTTNEFLGAFGARHAFRIDTSEITTEEAMETTASMSDYITDLNDIWSDCSMSQRLEFARSFVDLYQRS